MCRLPYRDRLRVASSGRSTRVDSVPASNPEEINHIATRLNQPSLELATWVAENVEYAHAGPPVI